MLTRMTPPEKIREAILLMRHARNLLRGARAKRAAARVRAALKSAEGAERHAICLQTRRTMGAF